MEISGATVYPDGPNYKQRSGWTIRSEIKRWIKAIFRPIPGRFGSYLRVRAHRFSECGQDVFIAEGFWVEYQKRLALGGHIGINQNCYINAGGGVEIQDWALIGPNVTIYSQNHDLDRLEMPLALCNDVRENVIIERGAWVAANVTILPGVTVGEGAVVAAGAVVSRDVLAYSIVAGVPARFIRNRGQRANSDAVGKNKEGP